MLDTEKTLRLKVTVRDPDTRDRLVDMLYRGTDTSRLGPDSTNGGSSRPKTGGSDPSRQHDVLIELRIVGETSDSEMTSTTKSPGAPPSKTRSARKEKIAATCELLDLHRVGDGEKAIAIGLAQHWTQQLLLRFGPPLSPATVRRWRAMKRLHGSRYLDERLHTIEEHPGINLQPNVAQVLYRHASQVIRNGGSMPLAYHAARSEIALINDGRHADHPQPEQPLRMFGFDTFRRACSAVQKALADGSE